MTEPIPYWKQLAAIRNGQAPKTTGPKPKKAIPKKSPKKIIEDKEKKEAGTDSQLDIFFNEMRKRLKGKCLFCNGATTYKNDELWRVAIAHLLPKSNFKSIAVNENNWVELCWNCHTEFDQAKITWLMLKDSQEWEVLKPKLEAILPLIHPDERKNKLYNRLIELIK